VEVEMESWPEAPPTKAPKVPEYERLRPSEGAEVATPKTPFVPSETKRFEEEGCEVVARPV
jgi:hypothetical protein